MLCIYDIHSEPERGSYRLHTACAIYTCGCMCVCVCVCVSKMSYAYDTISKYDGRFCNLIFGNSVVSVGHFGYTHTHTYAHTTTGINSTSSMQSVAPTFWFTMYIVYA